MMILITYDVETTTDAGRKRLRKVARECVNYGQRVQNSVFECVLDESHFVILRSKLDSIINHEADNIRFYFLGNNWQRKIDEIGVKKSYDVTSELII